MEEATTNIMVTTIVEVSKETMEVTKGMDMLALTIKMDNIVQTLSSRKILAKCYAISAITRVIMPMIAQKGSLHKLPSQIFSIRDM